MIERFNNISVNPFFGMWFMVAEPRVKGVSPWSSRETREQGQYPKYIMPNVQRVR